MFQIFEDTKIYVCCPSYAQTGGPEALHVLAYQLRNLGYDAVMCYNLRIGDPVALDYKVYNIPYVFEIEDNPHNIMIVPEIWENILFRYKNIQQIFYWLSVDNYLGSFLINVPDERINHFAQSYYALDFLSKHNVKNVYYLSDYLNEVYTKKAPKTFSNREDIILYNPTKGFNITEKIINNAPHLNFIPISKMDKQQIRERCLKSKIYIDFGIHPGKDRIPRECAVLGNIVITNKKGAACFERDVPISDEYKFENPEQDIDKIIKKLEYCLKNYDKCICDFERYRRKIKNEKRKFISDLKKVFGAK